MAQVLIASRLSDGLVVFLSGATSAGCSDWVLYLDAAAVARDDARASELLAIGEADAAIRHIVVEPYLIDVEDQDGKLRPTKYRELIRCLGPTTRLDHGKQAESSEA